jgi:putative addiction module CopG family antidote
MADRTIVLSDDDAAILDRLVADGGYNDTREALHESLKLAELARDSEEMRLAAFKAAIQVGIDDIAAGRCTRLETPEALAEFLDKLLSEPLDEPNR